MILPFLINFEMDPSVLSPCLLGVARIKRHFFSEGYSPHSAGLNTHFDEIVLYRFSPLLSQGEIILYGTSLIAVAFRNYFCRLLPVSSTFRHLRSSAVPIV